MAFQDLKERQSAVWANGRYEVISDTLVDAHEDMVSSLSPKPGERWLDLACGTGGVAEQAARAGAVVTGIDLASDLVETAKRRAAELGLEIDYRVGDCEDLSELGGGSYDVVSSAFGIMFCPDHRAAASELARVVRPGGRIGIESWRPDGEVGDMFRMLADFQPAPPPDVGAPLDWGRREYLEELLGDAFDLRFEERYSGLPVRSPEERWQLFAANFGPLKSLAESLDDQRREELHQAWVDFFAARYGTGPSEHRREYLLALGTRR